MEGLGVTADPCCRPEHIGHKLRFRQRVCLHELWRSSVVCAGELPFERYVLLRGFGMGAQVVPKRQVLPLLLLSSFTQMNVMCARPVARLVEERVHKVEV